MDLIKFIVVALTIIVGLPFLIARAIGLWLGMVNDDRKHKDDEEA